MNWFARGLGFFFAFGGLCSAGCASGSPRASDEAASAFISICGDARGNGPAAVRAAEGLSWNRSTPEEIGLIDDASMENLELRVATNKGPMLVLMVYRKRVPGAGILISSCSVTVYPTRGQAVADPTTELENWVGHPSQPYPDHRGRSSTFLFVDSTPRVPVNSIEEPVAQSAIGIGRLHGVNIIHHPGKTMIDYQVYQPL